MMDVDLQRLQKIQAYAEQHLWSDAIHLSETFLQNHPNYIPVLEVYACSLAHVGQIEKAIEVYQQGLLCGMSMIDVLDGVATAFMIHQKYKEALENYQLALQHDPNNIKIHQKLVIVYNQLGSIEMVIQSAQIVLKSNPSDHQTINNLASMYKNIGNIDQAMRLYNKAIELAPDDMIYQSNLLWCILHSEQYTVQKYLTAFQNFGNQHSQKQWKQSSIPTKNVQTIRIGFVSADINDHVVGHFFIPLLPFLSKRFEIFIYSNSIRQDIYTQQAKDTVHHFISIISMATKQVVELIQEHNIDILVDLSGHTAYHRLDVFLQKPATYQVTWLGCPTTTGISEIDYIIIPPDPYLLENKWSVETPIALKSSYYSREASYISTVYQKNPAVKKTTFVSKIQKEHEDEVLFACMNHSAKIGHECLRLWGQILRNVPHSKLLLIIKGSDQNIVQQSILLRCKRANIDTKRLVILHRLSQAEYFALYNSIDIVLDPFPFNGGTTNVDCLCMYKPFITLCGNTLHSRLGYNLLKQLQIPELIAYSKQQYIQIAVELAQKPNIRNEYTKKIQQNIQQSTLFKVDKFAEELGDVFEQIIHKKNPTQDNILDERNTK